MWIQGGAVNTTRTVTLRSHVTNGLRFFDEHDELYWNVTGDEWEVPIAAAAVEIQLPPATTGIRTLAFNGPYGSTAHEAAIAVHGTAITIVMPHPLGYHEGLTAVVGWGKGIVAAPRAAARAVETAHSNWPTLIPIPLFLLAFA